jgi:hypothetical protein
MLLAKQWHLSACDGLAREEKDRFLGLPDVLLGRIPQGIKGITVLKQDTLEFFHGELKPIFLGQFDKLINVHRIIVFNTELLVVAAFLQEIQHILS